MRSELTGPQVIDLEQGTVTWEAAAGCCDLCRGESELYRLLDTTDALCAGCFAMWHG